MNYELIKHFSSRKGLSNLFLLIFLSSFIYWIYITIYHPDNPIIVNQQTTEQTLTISGLARVIDGDTIEINKNRIRLIGIDAPEVKQKCLDKNYFEYLCGGVSTAFLKKLINNREVRCQYSEKDIYNRYLGSCFLKNININYEMVKNGMAIIYNLKDADQELKKLESVAQNNKIGIWQGAFQEPKQYRKTHRNRHYSQTKN